MLRLMLHSDEVKVDNSLRRRVVESLGALRFQPEAVGSVHRVDDGSGGYFRVTVVQVQGPAVPVADAEVHLISESESSRSVQPAIHGPWTAAEVVGDYVAEAWLAVPGSVACERDCLVLDSLVGTPARDVVNDLRQIVDLKNSVHEWAGTHYPGTWRSAYDGIFRPSSVMLFAGDPGTGKTEVARRAAGVLAEASQTPVIFVQLNERLRGSGIQGRAGSEMVSLISSLSRAIANSNLPAIVFLDEAEAIAGGRGGTDGGSGAQENVAVVDGLIVGIDRELTARGSRTALILATNLPSRLDTAVLRRARKYDFSRLDRGALRELASNLLGQFGFSEGDLDLAVGSIPDQENFPTAWDVISVVRDAVMDAAAEGAPLDVGAVASRFRNLVPTGTV